MQAANASLRRTEIDRAHVEAYLRARGDRDARILEFKALGTHKRSSKKFFGYGRPLLVTFLSAGKRQSIVVRTATPNIFGYARRSDRLASLALSFDTFGTVPRHVRPLDVGALNERGDLVSLPDGEPFLVTDFAEGTLYADALLALATSPTAPREAVDRAEALASYLGELHQRAVPPATYRSALREILTSGEGLLGILDSYQPDDAVATPARLQKLEAAILPWRWRLRPMEKRARVTHGDFHPFNILFRQGTDFTLLDCSRGAAGEPADDVACLTINYLFFALSADGTFSGAMRALWEAFWQRYLHVTGDREIFSVVAPWRSDRATSKACTPRVMQGRSRNSRGKVSPMKCPYIPTSS